MRGKADNTQRRVRNRGGHSTPDLYVHSLLGSGLQELHGAVASFDYISLACSVNSRCCGRHNFVRSNFHAAQIENRCRVVLSGKNQFSSS